jgi:aconitate hydratase
MIEPSKTKRYEGYCVIAVMHKGQVGEHAALAPKYLGQKFAIAKSYAHRLAKLD